MQNGSPAGERRTETSSNSSCFVAPRRPLRRGVWDVVDVHVEMATAGTVDHPLDSEVCIAVGRDQGGKLMVRPTRSASVTR